MTKQKTPTTPESILEGHQPDIRSTAEALRQIILDAVPEAAEKGLPGWHAIGYRHPRAGHFCAIFPMADRVRIAMEHGVELADPDGLMVTPPGGKQVRFIDIAPGQVIPEDGIVALMHAAIRLRS